MSVCFSQCFINAAVLVMWFVQLLDGHLVPWFGDRYVQEQFRRKGLLVTLVHTCRVVL